MTATGTTNVAAAAEGADAAAAGVDAGSTAPAAVPAPQSTAAAPAPSSASASVLMKFAGKLAAKADKAGEAVMNRREAREGGKERPPLPAGTMAVGTAVEANFNNEGDWYPGTIKKVRHRKKAGEGGRERDLDRHLWMRGPGYI